MQERKPSPSLINSTSLGQLELLLPPEGVEPLPDGVELPPDGDELPPDGVELPPEGV